MSDPERALAVQRRGLRDWIAMMAASSPSAELFERDGVTAALVPASPQRSIPNSVTYTDTDRLLELGGELDERYAAAGIAAWTVWVPEFDRHAIAGLEMAGHTYDGNPTAMSATLPEDEPELGDLEWDADGRAEEFGLLNDRAYGLDSESGFAPSLAEARTGGTLRLYRARDGGEVACVLGTIDHDRDLGFYFVATDPEHRGRGLASRLMAVAMSEARGRGLETASLQASAAGRSVYERLGFRADFRYALYERRR